MSDNERPLASVLAQGWAVANYSATIDPGTGTLMHCFLVQRQNRMKVVTVRKKSLGAGLVADEIEV